MTAETIHTCSYSCERPECIRAQRDELAARMTAETSNARGEWSEVSAVAEHIGNSLKFIDLHYPGTKHLDAGPILRNMRRWCDRLTAAIAAAPPPAAARGDVRDVLEKAQWGLYVAWDAVAALEDLQKRGVYVPRCADGKPSRADAGKDLEVIKAAYETVKQALAAEGVQAGEVDDSETAWREGWAMAYSGAGHLYGDDGELQDNRWPCIDWRRDSALEIRRKIEERGNRAWQAQLSQQPEARGVVDEAMVERAYQAWRKAAVAREGNKPAIRAALTAALAAQHQEPKS